MAVLSFLDTKTIRVKIAIEGSTSEDATVSPVKPSYAWAMNVVISTLN